MFSDRIEREEARIEARSAGFKKALGLRDLVLTQILFVVGLAWIGVAGKLGPAHLIFWLVAMTLFYIPSAVVVIYLNRLMPLEGGVYQWAKLGLNPFTGFMLAWNLWLYVILNTSEVGLQCATYLSYALGPRAAWMTESSWFVAGASVTIIGLLMTVSVIGLGVGKWIHNAGGVIILIIFGTVIAIPFLNVFTGHLASYRPLHTEAPVPTLTSLNILGKMGFGALGGFEYIAILAGETRAPARALGRSVMIAAPIIAAMFILGTSSMLAFIPPSEIDLIGPLPQVLTVGLRPFGVITYLASLAILMTLAVRLAQASVNFTGITRLPMVAGWDALLPAWFTRLHGKYRTPANSIFAVGAVTLVISLVSLIGVGQQEAFQLVFNASGIFYALTYLVLFAIPLIGLRSLTPRPPLFLRIAAASGVGMTLLYVVLSVFPIIQVGSVALFAVKIGSVIVGANIVGATLYLRARRQHVSAMPG